MKKRSKIWDESSADNNIGYEGAAKISELLMINATLTKLDLGRSDNIIRNNLIGYKSKNEWKEVKCKI